VRKLRVRATTAELHEPTGASERVLVKEASLSERILEQRVLQMLRVNTEDAAAQHQYLQEKLHCYLSLDASRLTATQPHLAEAGILERVGRICSDVVASCCYVLEVEEVGELPRLPHAARQLAHVSTTYQDFLERLEKLLKRFDKVRCVGSGAAPYVTHPRACRTPSTPSERNRPRAPLAKQPWTW